jgi:hypothetical protein
VVYGIVKQAGGDVQVSSRPGEGTRIDVYLPAVGVRTLFLSGYIADVFDDDEVAPLSIDLLPKPFTQAQLLRRVRSVLDRDV